MLLNSRMWPAHDGLRALVRAIRHADGWLASLWAQRQRIARHPALLLWGMRDPAFPPRYLERWTELFTRAEVHRLARTGHYPQEEEPETVARVIERYLARPLEAGAASG